MQWGRIEAVLGDLTKQTVDAIVNAANNALIAGGGVDGSVHRAAGPQLQAECRAIGGCPTGEARITRGYDLPARWVIHTVGPIWHGGAQGEPELLARCYRNVLAVAIDPLYGIDTIAFPSISTGTFGYPIRQAARVAVNEADRVLARTNTLALVRFVCFGDDALRAYEDAGHEFLD